jgi:hypothetical protein
MSTNIKTWVSNNSGTPLNGYPYDNPSKLHLTRYICKTHGDQTDSQLNIMTKSLGRPMHFCVHCVADKLIELGCELEEKTSPLEKIMKDIE